MTVHARKPFLALVLVLARPPQAAAQTPDPASYAVTTEAWDVTRPRGRTREIDFTTDEGTWMSVDLSPDGRWIVFDLLGHIYRVASSGGLAESLTQSSGIAVNYHPRISPDGTEIAFISDRGGQANLWVMKADGSAPRPIHLEMGALAAEPTWTPDGWHIVVSRGIATPLGLFPTADLLWSYPREGGPGAELVRLRASGSRSDWSAGPDRANWPSISPDGRYVYFHSSLFAPDDRALVAGDNRRLRRLDRQTGRIDDLTAPFEQWGTCCGRLAYPFRVGDVGPEPSPDGRWLAFARRLPGGKTSYRGKEYTGRTALWLRDLRTGEEQVLMDPISNAEFSGWPSWKTRAMPGYAWAKDSQSLVISQGGKLRRVWVADGRVETIPFTARVRRTISEQARGHVEIEDESFQPRFLRWPASSPDGRLLVFEATGRLWVAGLRSAADADEGAGAVGVPRRTELGTGAPGQARDIRPLAAEPAGGFQLDPEWTADGRWVVYASWEDEAGGHVWRVRPGDGAAERLTRTAGRYRNPVLAEDARSLVVDRWDPALPYAGAVDGWRRVRLPLHGGQLEVVGPALVRSPRARGAGPADRTGFRWRQDVYVGPPTVDARPRGDGARRLSTRGGRYPRWRDTRTLEFVGANMYFAHDVATGRTDTVPIRFRVERRIPRGSVALTNARIVTLSGDGRVIERGTVLVRRNRIACVGECDVAGADRVLDASGATIVPGWLDTHAHHGNTGIHADDADFIPQHRHTSARYLAYGITTVMDPAVNSDLAFPVAEMIEAGRIVGPRSYSTGEALFCGAFVHDELDEIRTLEDALRHVERHASYGALSIKDRQQCTRTQRQMLAEAARRAGISITAEAGHLEYLLGLLMQGQTGWEHPLHYVPTYSDVVKFVAQAGGHYSPQLMLSDYAHGSAIEYWFGQEDLWSDAKTLAWSPWQEVAARRSFVKKPPSEYQFPILAEVAAAMKRAGGYLTVGAHGEQDGLGTHWDAWTLGFAMTPMEVLEAWSRDGAHFIGLEDEIGSLEVGKLADLVVLNANPLDDVRNTIDIRWVMKDGVVREADTLDEIWPERRPYGFKPWLVEDVLRTDTRPDDWWDRR